MGSEMSETREFGFVDSSKEVVRVLVAGKPQFAFLFEVAIWL